MAAANEMIEAFKEYDRFLSHEPDAHHRMAKFMRLCSDNRGAMERFRRMCERLEIDPYTKVLHLIEEWTWQQDKARAMCPVVDPRFNRN